MKKKFFFLIIFLILISFLSSPAIFFRVFPQALISSRRLGFFSPGWIKEKGNLLPERKVLGIEDLSVYPSSYPFTFKQAPLLSSQACQRQLSSWLINQKGIWGVVVYDLVQKEKFSFRGEQKFHAASVMKLATAVSVFNWIEENNEELESIIWGASLEQRLTLLINKSDNYQWADLESLVSLARTQKILEENGLLNSDIYTNTMTAEDVFLLLKKIYEEELIQKEHRNFLFKIMQNTINESRIPAAVPEEIAVVHKYGTWQSNIHDAAIVFYQSPYILVVLTNATPQAETRIADFSAQVYQIFSQRKCWLK